LAFLGHCERRIARRRGLSKDSNVIPPDLLISGAGRLKKVSGRQLGSARNGVSNGLCEAQVINSKTRMSGDEEGGAKSWLIPGNRGSFLERPAPNSARLVLPGVPLPTQASKNARTPVRWQPERVYRAALFTR
jgi:hypothetical protein